MAENGLMGRVPAAEEQVNPIQVLKDELEAELAPLDDDYPGYKAACVKYAPLFQTMTEKTQLYSKNRLAIKYGSDLIKDKDTRALWIAMRKVLYAIRALSIQM